MIRYRECLKPLTPYVPGRFIADVKREYGLSEVVKLASNENPYGCPPAVKRAIAEAAESAALYPDGSACALKEALREKLRVSAGRIVIGAGADEIISMLCKAFAGEGDEVLTGELTFPQYAASAISTGAKVAVAPMKNYGFDLEATAAAVTDDTRLIFIANPNNPTGAIHTADEQRKFLLKLPKRIIVVFDEAYGEFAIGRKDFPNTLMDTNEFENAVWLKTFSKAYGLAGLRVGYAVCSEEIVSIIEKIRNPFNTSSVSQAAAAAALSDKTFVRETAAKNAAVRAYTLNELDRLGVVHAPTEANFVFADFGAGAVALVETLTKRGFIVRPTAAAGFLRITFGTMEQMERFIKILKEVL